MEGRTMPVVQGNAPSAHTYGTCPEKVAGILTAWPLSYFFSIL